MRQTRTLWGIAALAGLALLAMPAQAQEQDQRSRITGLTLSGDKPIQIESDKLEVRDTERLAVFTGNVNVVQGDTNLKAGVMRVHYANSQAGEVSAPGAGNIERIEVDGKVYVKSKEQVATGDSGTFDMGTEVLVLTGKEVVLTDGPNVIVGCKLTVQMKTGEAKLDGCGQGTGRVKMLLQPNSKSQ